MRFVLDHRIIVDIVCLVLMLSGFYPLESFSGEHCLLCDANCLGQGCPLHSACHLLYPCHLRKLAYEWKSDNCSAHVPLRIKLTQFPHWEVGAIVITLRISPSPPAFCRVLPSVMLLSPVFSTSYLVLVMFNCLHFADKWCGFRLLKILQILTRPILASDPWTFSH